MVESMDNTYDYVIMEESNKIPDTVKLNNIGVEKCLRGDFQGGISDFTKALVKSPDNPTVLKNRSEAYADASIIDRLCSVGFRFTPPSLSFYDFFNKFKSSR